MNITINMASWQSLIVVFLVGFWLAKMDSRYGRQAGLWLAELTKTIWRHIA